jgi:hypothetical protein
LPSGEQKFNQEKRFSPESHFASLEEYGICLGTPNQIRDEAVALAVMTSSAMPT